MSSTPQEPLNYRAAGVDTYAAGAGLSRLLYWVRQTLEFRQGLGESLVPIGFFASVVRLTDRLSLALSTDGVGSKAVVAQMMGQYEGIGVDCVAVNVNDVLCVGAEPVALLDYISLQQPQGDMLEQLGRGLHRGAERARIAVVGGELSQHPDTLTGPRAGHAFDISGTAVGVLDDRLPITGSGVQPGDVVLGLPSDGIHSNGLTLARRVLLGDDSAAVELWLPECGRTVGEELLRPTHIYAPEITALLLSGVTVKGLAHISGDGLLNLARLHASVGYRITTLPPIPPVFDVIQAAGVIPMAEMFRVFNMGVGFCAVVNPTEVDAAMAAIAGVGGSATPIGEVVEDEHRRVYVDQHRLVGEDGRFFEAT
jgi:phosphoribosylformylglycinamidine cyclo-ligase